MAQTDFPLVIYKYNLVSLLHASASPAPSVGSLNVGVMLHVDGVVPKHVSY